jgi:hypothetical protein
MNLQRLQSSRKFSGADALALAAVAALFVVLLGASWRKWLHPIVDHGREINLPTRILAGEALYRDVQFLYGPFAPHFNALLYRLFGIRLSVLHASGVACAGLMTLMLYWLARRLMNPWEAAAATGLALIVCAFHPGGNYVQPYTYSALYGEVFALASLGAVAVYLRCGRANRLFWAGVLAGMAAISKWELSLAAVAAACAALALDSFSARRPLWRKAAVFAAPAALIIAGAFALALRRVAWRQLLDDNHVFFTSVPPQLIYFNRIVSGLNWPRSSLLYSLSGLGVAAWWVGASALVGAAGSWRSQNEWRGGVKRAVILLLLGTAWWGLIQSRWNYQGGATPFSAAAILLPLVALSVGWRVWRARAEKATVAFEERLLLVISVFGFVSILRVLLNVSMDSPYTPFMLPVVFIAYLALLFRYAPGFFAGEGRVRVNIRRAALAFVALALFQLAYRTINVYRARYTYPIQTARGEFITDPPLGRLFSGALRYAQEHTSPGEYVAGQPQLTALNFFAERPYPLREEVNNPGLLQNDDDAIMRLKARRVRLIFLCNLYTPDFIDGYFGVDYNQKLMGWIRGNCRPEARFDSEGTHGAEYEGTGLSIVAYRCNP